MEEPAMMQETVEGIGEMPEIIVVSDAVDGISPRERVQQRTAEKFEVVPQRNTRRDRRDVEVGLTGVQQRIARLSLPQKSSRR